MKYYFILNTKTEILSRQKNGMAEASKLSVLEWLLLEATDQTDITIAGNIEDVI